MQRHRLERVGVRVEAAHQLDQQERVAPRLPGELDGPAANGLVVLAQQIDDQLGAFLDGQRRQLDLAVGEADVVLALQLLPGVRNALPSASSLR